jgi:thiamine-phosphate pyrophosphorylase
MILNNFLYPILDYDFCNLHQIPIDSLPLTWELYSKTVPFFQLRAKSLRTSEYLELYKSIRKITKLPIIINDHLEIALQEKAFGIHIGKEDYSLLAQDMKRKLKATDFLKGTSSHSVKDLEELESFWDYTGIGPIFPTNSKISPYPALGMEIIFTLAKDFKIPLVPIGGLTSSHIKELRDLPNVIPASISLFSDPAIFSKIVSIWHKNIA